MVRIWVISEGSCGMSSCDGRICHSRHRRMQPVGVQRAMKISLLQTVTICHRQGVCRWSLSLVHLPGPSCFSNTRMNFFSRFVTFFSYLLRRHELILLHVARSCKCTSRTKKFNICGKWWHGPNCPMRRSFLPTSQSGVVGKSLAFLQ